jgi:murein L,D-transpeptidase YcbB/YkuD
MVAALIRAMVMAMTIGLSMAPARADLQLSWFDAQRPGTQAVVATELLRQAFTYGLDPADYQAQALTTAVQNALQSGNWDDDAQQRLNAALTEAMERYLSDLQSGRVTPEQVQASFAPRQRPHADVSLVLRQAVAGRQLSQAVQTMARHTPMAPPLQAALQRYRDLVGAPQWWTPLPLPDGGKLVAGQNYPDLHMLAQRLQALGDLVAEPAMPALFAGAMVAEPTTPALFTGALVEAVRTFQRRHGLDPVGVIGRLTLAQLNVTPALRVRQIELTLERLRWTPLLQGRRMIVVNVPEFMLRAYTVRPDGVDIALEMKIIVGKALDTRTPLFDEDMLRIEFSPYWNVPRSIALSETVPRLRKDPAYFTQQGFEFVTPERTVVSTLSKAHLEAVQLGHWRIRQRPGPKNALGAIKFIFPNNGNIYLHHTPEPKLFARERRDFSHGCIRVEAPVALAQFVLQEEPQWTEERIRGAMEGGVSRTFNLRQPLPVLIAYATVVVKHGAVYFYDDLYGNDRLLDQALRARSAALGHARVPTFTP